VKIPASRWLVASVLGGVMCVVGDHLHVAEGVLYYPRTALWNQAWWVFPLFFGATIVVLAGVRLVHPDPPPRLEHPVRLAMGDLLAFATAYAFTAFASSLPNVVLCVLLGLWVARVVHGMPLRHVVFCLITALLGTSWEAMWSGIGMFTYTHPDFAGVPRWLPALYLHAAAAAESSRQLLEGRSRAPAPAPGNRTNLP
jgi:hypothetical protein